MIYKMIRELTLEEKKAIKKLRRALENWPKTIWLYVSDGTINIMSYDENGYSVETRYGGVDPDYVLDYISGCKESFIIDGGGW